MTRDAMTRDAFTDHAPNDGALRDALARGLDTPAPPASARLAGYLARAFGEAALAVIEYGSHVQQSDARPESAHDCFVVVTDYGDAYRAVAAAVGTRYRPTTAALLSRVLPPNVIALTDRGAEPALQAKCAVLSLRDFRRACSPRARDHFVHGRLFQQVRLAWARDPATRAAVVGAIVAARAHTFAWGRASLPARFDAADYCRALLETAFAAEIRPEGPGRVDVLLAAQAETIVPMYDALLQSLVRRGVLGVDDGRYADPGPPGHAARRRWARYFHRSKARATLRWSKYVALYDDWLEYILRKLARRSGGAPTLTARERRWPLVFLWPKVIRFVRSRPQRQG